MTEWRNIPGWPYQVSDDGQVRSLDRVIQRSDGQTRRLRGRIRLPYPKRTGHLKVRLEHEARSWTTDVHRLVAAVFIGPRPEGMEVRHLDGDPTNNVVTNLVYGTRYENAQDTLRHGRNPYKNRTHCPQDHPYDEMNTFITKEGWRRCRTCMRERDRKRYWLAKGVSV